ncbi:ESX secretion-associated protein EspG [Actinophytocola glycyrrhizae]|uniref:ESX secretion-associated protein EspG n=1 Tax=Actinophytocola glycyrrhizae TaxID=2044873 RepID=A0ABV9RWD7_9PSEU
MTATTERHEVHFGLVELDLLATHAGVPFPFPLRVPSFGRLTDERDELLAAAGHALRERGLATEHGPAGVAAEVVTALREYRSAADLVVLDGEAATGVVAMVCGNQAMLCRQSLAGQADTVLAGRVPAAALADEFAGLVPDVPAASAMPVTLPPGVIGDALRLVGNTADTPATRRYVRELVRECGGDEAVVDELVDLLPTLTGRGQLGVTRRSGTAVSRRFEVSWLDSPRGRVRVSRDDQGWVSVNPLRRGELVRLTREAAALARA